MFLSTTTPLSNSSRLEQHTDAPACNVHEAIDRIATQRVALAAQSVMWLSRRVQQAGKLFSVEGKNDFYHTTDDVMRTRAHLALVVVCTRQFRF